MSAPSPDGFGANVLPVNNPTQKASRVRQRGRTGVPIRVARFLVERYHPCHGLVGRSVCRSLRGAGDGGGSRFRFSQPREGHRGGGYPHHTKFLAAAPWECRRPSWYSVRTAKVQALSAQASAFHDRFVRAPKRRRLVCRRRGRQRRFLVDTAAAPARVGLGSGGRTALIWAPPEPRDPSTTCSRSTTTATSPL